ncbi:MAG: hypothetical protein ACRBBR_08390 [Cellvibrionaceae bacterium]
MTLFKYLTPIFTATLLNASFSLVAHANIEVRFVEGAPKDEFLIQNTGQCSIKQFTLDIDLSSSEGNLIFDTTNAGQGVEVFQPFEATSGQFELISQTNGNEVKDGDNTLSLKVPEIKPQQVISFTIDVDDKLENSQLGQIQVTGSEIKGALAKLNINQENFSSGPFGKNNKAIVTVPSCA